MHKHVNVQRDPGGTGTLLLQHLWNTPQFAGQNEWSAGKLLSWRRRPQGVRNRSARQDPTVTTVETGAALLTAIKRKEIKIGKVWRIYLFPAAKADRLIVPGCDDFSGSATRSLKPVQISRVLSCVQLLWVSFGANSPNLPAASAQSGWLHSASQCEAPSSAPRSTEANYFFVMNLRATVEPDTLVRPLPPQRLLSVLAPQRLDELHSGVRTSTNTNLFRAAGWGRKKKKKEKNNTYVSVAFLRSLTSSFLRKLRRTLELLLPFGRSLCSKSQMQERCFPNLAGWKIRMNCF